MQKYNACQEDTDPKWHLKHRRPVLFEPFRHPEVKSLNDFRRLTEERRLRLALGSVADCLIEIVSQIGKTRSHVLERAYEIVSLSYAVRIVPPKLFQFIGLGLELQA